MDQVDPREMQALQHYLQEYGQQADVLVQQLQALEEGRMEALAAIDALKELLATPEDTVLLPLGGGASVRARVIEPESVLLNIGADIALERSNTDAVEFLKDRVTEMEASAKKVAETIDRIRSQMNEIARRIESGYQQAQKSAQTGQVRGG